MRMTVVLAAIVALLGVYMLGLLGGVSPVLKKKESYIGTWKAKGAELKIISAGQMTYSRAATQTQVEQGFFNVPIKRIADDEIVGKLADVRLAVTEPPHQVGGEWQMRVNGDLLVKE